MLWLSSKGVVVLVYYFLEFPAVEFAGVFVFLHSVASACDVSVGPYCDGVLLECTFNQKANKNA